MDLPEGQHQGYSVTVSGEVEYLNCPGAVNQRRVDVRGAYALSAQVCAQSEQEVITALADRRRRAEAHSRERASHGGKPG